MDTGAQDTWRRTYGGYGVDECRTVIHTMDGGFLFGGSTGSFETDGDMYVVKTDASGVVQWSLPFGGLGVQNSVAVVESDPDFFLAGMTALGGHGGYDFTLTALGHTGSILWVSDIGTPDWDLCADMDRMEEGFILVGTTYHGDPAGDVWVVRTDEVGDTVWTRRLGGAGLDEAFGVNVDGSGHILVAGRLDGDSDDEDGFLARLTSNGEVDWLERFGGDSADVAFDVVESEDGAYVLVGATNSYATVPQVLVRKMDQAGGLVWQREYGTLGETRMRRIVKWSNGYAMAGFNTVSNAGGKDMFLIVLDGSGEWVRGKNYGGLGDEEGTCLQALPDEGFVVAGFSQNYGPGPTAFYAVRTAPDAETADDTVYPYLDPVGIQDVSHTPAMIRVVPNPNNGHFRIGSDPLMRSFEVTDLSGRTVEKRSWGYGDGAVDVNADPGAYVLSVQLNSGATIRVKFVIDGR